MYTNTCLETSGGYTLKWCWRLILGNQPRDQRWEGNSLFIVYHLVLYKCFLPSCKCYLSKNKYWFFQYWNKMVLLVILSIEVLFYHGQWLAILNFHRRDLQQEERSNLKWIHILDWRKRRISWWNWCRVVKLSEGLLKEGLSLEWVVSDRGREGHWWPGEASFLPRMLWLSSQEQHLSAGWQFNEHVTQDIHTGRKSC